jgi:hypothetical protein
MPNPSSNRETQATVAPSRTTCALPPPTTTHLFSVGAPLPVLIPVLILVLFLAASLFAQKKPQSPSVFVSDKGKFKILLDGKPVGQEEFEINQSGVGWIAKGTTHITVEGTPPATVTGNLSLEPGGAPISYEWTSQSSKNSSAHIAFVNNVAKMNIQIGAAHPFEQDLTFNSPLIVILDDNLYDQYAVLARVYDWNRRGTQTFSVLVPQELLPGNITVDWSGAVSAEGKSYEGLKVTSSDLEVILYLDSSHRLMRLEVPSSKAAIIRE